MPTFLLIFTENFCNKLFAVLKGTTLCHRPARTSELNFYVLPVPGIKL